MFESVAATAITKLLGLSWRDYLQQASFKNVPFYVLNSDTSVGRRTVIHEYPFREENYVEDLGIASREFIINGYVIASKSNDYNYFNQRDDLISVLEEKGGGTLVHPYLGTFEVSLQGKARVSESSEEGGIARFVMTFIKTGVNRYPIEDLDNVKAMDDQALDSENKLQDSFGAKYKPDSLTNLSKITSTVQSLYSAQRKIMAAIQGGPRSLIGTALGYIDSSAANLFESTMRDACSLAANIISSYNSFKNIGGIVGDFTDNIISGLCSGSITKRKTGVDRQTTAQESMIDSELGRSIIISTIEIVVFGDSEVPTQINSFSSASESAAREHLRNFIVNDGLTSITQLAVRIDYRSSEDANYIMGLVNDAIDSQLERLGDNVDSASYTPYGITIEDDESYEALKDLRMVFCKSMQNIAANLPPLIDYNIPNYVVPALVIAYDNYKDLNREEEIIKRNQLTIPHPGFPPSGEKIKILSY